MAFNTAHMNVAGNLVADPQQVFAADTVNNRPKLVRLRVAVNSGYHRDDHNNWQAKNCMFIDVDCWGELAENIQRSLKKGDPVVAIGRMVQDEWEEQVPSKDNPQELVTRKRSALKLRATHAGPDLNARMCVLGETHRKATAPLTEQLREEILSEMRGSGVGSSGETQQSGALAGVGDQTPPF